MSSVEPVPKVFDPRALCNDLIDAGFRITAHRPVRTMLDGDEDLRPRFSISPMNDREFNSAYRVVMERWAEAMDACPDHVEQVVDYAFDQLQLTDRQAPRV